MASTGLRIGVVGATGALGAELIQALAASSIRVSQIVPMASERSLGMTVEFQGVEYAVETDASSPTAWTSCFSALRDPCLSRSLVARCTRRFRASISRVPWLRPRRFRSR